MACGKGIVATDVGGIREALDGCGLLVRSSHPQELSGAIVKLMSDKPLREKLGAAALRKVQERFTLENSLRQYAEQYELLSSRKELRLPASKGVSN